MHVHVLSVGKIKERGLRELIDDYTKRIGRYASYHELELKDADHGELDERFRKAIPPRSRVYALEVEGRAVSSHELAALVGKAEDTSVMNLVFLIGGSYGLPPATSSAADAQLSLSKLILPHRLARLLLVEQIYRAFTILRNEPYSH
ncbi:MAG: m3Psi1915 methyltransferase RlmH [Myxococcaceae bacterium]|nr:m3Psi1915 methyltransferase RlmH [Myxococcaceae bacterium]